MHSRGRLPAIVVLLACVMSAGCAADGEPSVNRTKASGSVSSTPTVTPSPSASSATPAASETPVTLAQARRQWDEALNSTADGLTGRYDWGAWVTGQEEPLMTETGHFGLAPLRAAYERVITPPAAASDAESDPEQLTVRVRRRGEALYMQMDPWGPWDGCWLRVTDEVIPDSMDFDLSESVSLPVPVVVALDATITSASAQPWFGDTYDEYTGEVSAIEAMQFLGVSPQKLLSRREALERARVPITVAVFGGRIKGAAARGPDILAALADAGVRIGANVRTYLDEVSAGVNFSSIGSGAVVRLPPPRLVLPEGATRYQACPAKAPTA